MGTTKLVCQLASCSKKKAARGFCDTHYRRFKKHGDPNKTLYERHGMSKNGTMSSYGMMIDRCYNLKNARYKDYGGRGITVCDEWKNSFSAFYKSMGTRPAGLTIERNDPNGNYEPSNCRWADRKTQSRNRRDTRYIVYDGVKIKVVDLVDAIGINLGTFRSRLDKLNWTVEEAIYGKERPNTNSRPSY